MYLLKSCKDICQVWSSYREFTKKHRTDIAHLWTRAGNTNGIALRSFRNTYAFLHHASHSVVLFKPPELIALGIGGSRGSSSGAPWCGKAKAFLMVRSAFSSEALNTSIPLLKYSADNVTTMRSSPLRYDPRTKQFHFID